jgi:DNA-binding XRE family transcriptional regulator
MLKAAREWSGLTQKEVAENLGVSITSVSGWEVGRKTPSLRNQNRLVKLYAGYIEDHHHVETFSNMTKKELINTLLEIMDKDT